jgi:uncharacterized protein YidB (DUF937 family)
MGLLDSIVGAAANAALGGNNNQQGGLGGLAGGLLGSLMGGNNQQGAGGSNMAAMIPMLLPVLAGMLANNGSQGGLGGLVEKFTQAGLGNAVQSWIGTGENQAVNGDQVTQALGSGFVGDVASKLGLDQGAAAGLLAQALPAVINQLTPQGQAPQGGLGNDNDLMGMLGNLLK